MNRIIIFDDKKDLKDSGTDAYCKSNNTQIKIKRTLALKDANSDEIRNAAVIFIHTHITGNAIAEFIKVSKNNTSNRNKFVLLSGGEINQDLKNEIDGLLDPIDIIFVTRYDLIFYFEEFITSCEREDFNPDKIDLSILRNGIKGRYFDSCYDMIIGFIPLHILLSLSENEYTSKVGSDDWQKSYLKSLSLKCIAAFRIYEKLKNEHPFNTKIEIKEQIIQLQNFCKTIAVNGIDGVDKESKTKVIQLIGNLSESIKMVLSELHHTTKS